MNMSPALGIEMLSRLLKIIKDYCGMLTEEAVRKNFSLIYELLDEAIVLFLILPSFSGFRLSARHIQRGAGAVRAQQARGDRRPEGFPFIERLNVMLACDGTVLSQSIDGSLTMRSYLNGCPPVRMLLSQNLLVGKDTPIPVVQDETGRTLSAEDFIIVDDMNFHQCMNLEKFESDRLLSFNPPEGEFVAMNYRVTMPFRVPFMIRPMVEEKSETKIELILQVKSLFEPDVDASNVFIAMHTPHDTTTCSVTLASDAVGQTKEYREKDHRVLWMISKVSGQKEYYLKVIFNLEKPATQFVTKEATQFVTKEIGPIT